MNNKNEMVKKVVDKIIKDRAQEMDILYFLADKKISHYDLSIEVISFLQGVIGNLEKGNFNCNKTLAYVNNWIKNNYSEEKKIIILRSLINIVHCSEKEFAYMHDNKIQVVSKSMMEKINHEKN